MGRREGVVKSSVCALRGGGGGGGTRHNDLGRDLICFGKLETLGYKIDLQSTQSVNKSSNSVKMKLV